MDDFTDRYECAECGKELTADRKPCPSCGSTRRNSFVPLSNEVEAGSSLNGLAKIKDIKSFENPTRHKSREAEYFLSMMKQAFEDDDKFAFNLSAFLSAARSITWYMQKQYARRNGFAEWYCQNKIKMSADPELKYLNEARVEDVKREPVKTGATRAITFGVDVILGEAPPKSEQTKESEKPPTQSSTKTIRRFFPKFGDIDVIEFCEKQLDKLNKKVEECEKQFLVSES